MAFAASGWQGGITHGPGRVMIHHYRSPDALATVDASGYFNSVAKTLVKGDQIMVSGDAAGTPFAQTLMVTSADAASPVTTIVAA
jgi:uncharacterized membrane protein YraQ (UPF0718 family)